MAARSAYRIYKCRLCGGTIRDELCLDPDRDLKNTIDGDDLWRPPIITHQCSPVLTGLADFAGVEYDRAATPAPPADRPAAQPEPPHAEAP